MLDAGKRCDSGPCLTCWTWVSWWRAVNHYCLILQSTPQSKSEFLIFCCESSTTNPNVSPSVCHACYSCTETLKCYSPWTSWTTWPTWSTKVAASRSSNFLQRNMKMNSRIHFHISFIFNSISSSVEYKSGCLESGIKPSLELHQS